MSRRPRAAIAMSADVAARLLDGPVRRRLAELAEVDASLVVTDFTAPEARSALAGAEVLYTCWGCPPLTAEVLAGAPRLRAVVHAAGSVKHHITDACWERGLRVSSAAIANALPVAEFTLAAILFAGKRVLEIAHLYRRDRAAHDWDRRFPGFGNYRRTVGIVGASTIGRRVIELLRPFDLDVLVSDPYLDAAGAARLGVRSVELDELVAGSDVVSLHAPDLPSTRHMIDGRRLALMRDGATLINTARGALVDQAALTGELLSGRLHAVIDVTEPEVPPASSPLYDLPNVLLTPHIAGSLGGELRRMADVALDELERYAHGLPFRYGVAPEALTRSA
ncbi:MULTISPECIES: hydroxyacid dehydrogenase [Streptosporangium]|uniref:Phosphoglycerate dehydrogenase-like enzyme n=1 Tax=Streptosporangium brasiliense TaxID=47480 RepID=A0ABT9R053_9ACTN|nr:hydroxyacid dehydrogenase [Streptosporangium brasiliense]MDP9862222.1 phosphoglycerate dehydrogenase-like enzyme [Streptosporangium brasiliense]